MFIFRYCLQHYCRFSVKFRYLGRYQLVAYTSNRAKISTTNILSTVSRPLFNHLSTNSGVDQDVNPILYEELAGKLRSGPLCLIDVREPGELANDGFIEESIPIPLGTLQTALNYSNEEFREMYGVSKPKYGEEIILMCRMGVRSRHAVKIASSVGYTNVRHYAEGWDGWKNKIYFNT